MTNREHKHPVRIVNAVAPIRICDNGGWTDTWFAEYGKIFNIGVYPYAEVQIEVYPFTGEGERIVIHAENYGEYYVLDHKTPGWNRHPLLEAAIERMGIPEETDFSCYDLFRSTQWCVNWDFRCSNGSINWCA